MKSKLLLGFPLISLSTQCSQCCSRILTTRSFITSSRRPTFTAAPEIDFSDDSLPDQNRENARLVPASPSYFTTEPKTTDDLLSLRTFLRRYQTLPIVPPGYAPRIAWRTLEQYRIMVGEPVSPTRYHRVMRILHRLNQIVPSLRPLDLRREMGLYERNLNPIDNKPKPGIVDADGRAYGIGRRKSSSAKVCLVQGEGEVLVNGKSINRTFGRIHDRESALWALKATDRMSKYNVWALVSGGGTTGQAEAITLGAAKALMVHEPDLKPALRRGKSLMSFTGVASSTLTLTS